jgi:uncharacterized protein (TIGR02266 family)
MIDAAERARGNSRPSLPQKRDSQAVDWSERRSAPRREVFAEVDFGSETNFYTGFTVDVSTGGLFVVTWDTFPVGTHVHLSFTLPGSRDKVSVEGEVRWLRAHNPANPDMWPGMGIRFKEIPERSRELIDAFVRSRDPLFYE